MQHVVQDKPEPYSELSKSERRKYPRTVSHTSCEVRTSFGVQAYEVENLSVCGALLTCGPLLEIGRKVLVTLHVPLYPDVEVWARVRRHCRGEGGVVMMGIEFQHVSDVTEDHIQAALLSELERSHTHGRIPVLT